MYQTNHEGPTADQLAQACHSGTQELTTAGMLTTITDPGQRPHTALAGNAPDQEKRS